MTLLCDPPAPPRPVPQPFKLRPYQERALEMVSEAGNSGLRAPLLVLPTGAGKTVIGAELMRREVEAGGRALFLAPRRELVHQTSGKLDAAGVEHGVILAGCDELRNIYAQAQVASIDTLIARVMRRDPGSRLVIPTPSLVLVDEAHLSITEVRREMFALWPQAVRVGLTATPTRKDGRALGTLYDCLLEPTTTAELTAFGFLCPARYFSLSVPDLTRVKVVAGDYNAGQLEEAVNRPRLVGDIVNTWLARAGGRRTVVFASSIAHSVALCEEFVRQGVAAEHVDANTPQEMREDTFGRFRRGVTQVLTNCFLAAYGFDLPDLSCVVLARPTKSLMMFLQMVGRGLRTAPGKTDCLVLDHSGCVHQHGLATDAREWTLDGDRAVKPPVSSGSKKPKGEGKLIDCPECACTFSGTRTCPECGYHLGPKGKEVETLEGELVEIGEGLSGEDLDRCAWYSEVRGYCTERGWSHGAAAHKFKTRFGAWPPWAWNSMPAAKPSPELRRWMVAQSREWIKEKHRQDRVQQAQQESVSVEPVIEAEQEAVEVSDEAYSVLAALANAGGRVYMDGDRLKVGPRDAVTPELLERLKAVKPDLVRLLT